MDSDQQFQHLLTHLIARVDKMLATQEPVAPLGLALRAAGKVDISIGKSGNPPNVQAMTIALREAMIKSVAEGGVLASCIAFPHDAGPALIALLENSDNDCATVSIPILDGTPRRLDRNAIQKDEGYIYVFPVLDEE